MKKSHRTKQRNKKTKKNQINKNMNVDLSPYLPVGILLACLAVAGGILLPRLVLKHMTDRQLSVVETAPESYYLASGTAMAKNASEQLSSLDRIKLISGVWESNCVQVSSDEGNLSESEIISLVKSQMEYYYKQNVYPYSLSSTYSNWYSWTTELYRYTDTVFNTYTTYLWVVHFTRFDNTLEHTILITENGTILAAQVNDSNKPFSSIKKIYMNENINDILGDSNIKLETVSENVSGYDIPQYPYIDVVGIFNQNIYQVQLSSKGNDAETFYIYQYKTDTTYGFGIAP